MKKTLKIFLLTFVIFILVCFFYFFVGETKPAKEIIWGVNFSQKQAQYFGLDWKENYLALLDDLEVKNFKLATYWDLIEPEKDKFYFGDLDWQINEAEKENAKILLVIGMKSPRWPECHIPDWAKNLSKEEQQKEILGLIKKLVLRYRDSNSLEVWQIENEPFFPFGECPWVDKEFLKKEIELVKNLDNKGRPILISDSGEGSFWIQAARYGDIVGTTMYKKVWFYFNPIYRKFPNFPRVGFYIAYPFPSVFYYRKAKIIDWIFKKEVVCIELQAEPWGPKLIWDLPLEEQEKTMNLEKFKQNIEFAKKTGISKFYLWGSEWWYWLKEKHNRPEIWKEAKKLF
ncbi:hypothetical protein AMJ49_00915 [Parcubacteria bacterium DG_74_2]|nr:MAG: hypothetical protein AMJ49_00915 [Parcubacteria bacterium DG_74_2]